MLSPLDAIAVCKLMLHVYGYHTEKLALSVARCIIFEEVRLQTDAGTLFRANSTATTFMAAFAREIGKSYLENTLSPIVKKIITDTKKGVIFEVDPLKVSKASEVKVNSKNYEKLVRSVVKAIIKSTSSVPIGLREICVFLRESISQRFPNSKYMVVADAPTPAVRRAIMLTCKFIQTMSNDQNFSKEPYMVPFNPLIEELTPEIHAWFDSLASIPPDDGERGFNSPITIDIYLNSLKELHSFHKFHIKLLVEILASRKEDEEETSYFDESQLYSFLMDLSRLNDLPDYLPEGTILDKVRFASYNWEEESSQSSGPMPEALPEERRRHSHHDKTKKSKVSTVEVHEGQKERRRRFSSASGAAQNPSSTNKKWSFKSIMGSKTKSHSAEFPKSEGEVEGSGRNGGSPLVFGTYAMKSSASAQMPETVTATANASPRLSLPSSPLVWKASSLSNQVQRSPLFQRARRDSEASQGSYDSLKANPFSRSASSLHSHQPQPKPEVRNSKEAEEGSTEYKSGSEHEISESPDDASETEASDLRPSSTPTILHKISKIESSSRLSGNWRDASSAQESSDLDNLSASLHDDNVEHE